jgi:hypothetical protein
LKDFINITLKFGILCVVMVLKEIWYAFEVF